MDSWSGYTAEHYEGLSLARPLATAFGLSREGFERFAAEVQQTVTAEACTRFMADCGIAFRRAQQPDRPVMLAARPGELERLTRGGR